MKKTGIILALFMMLSQVQELNAGTVLESSWSSVARGLCDDQTAAWWSSAEAIRIAENVLLYQKDIGGWYKNTDFHLVLTENEKASLLASKSSNAGCTIDNGAVSYELTYLARVYGAISDETFKAEIKEGFVKGVQYLLDMQYDNGGWPQFYPLRGGYSDHITYNDDAMVHAMEILRHVHQKDDAYAIKVDDTMAAEAGVAFDKGLECILETQWNQKGLLTAWCAQHHYATLLPAMARSYELASISGGESAGIIYLLMSIDNPSDDIIRAVYASSNWYDDVRISGIRIESFVNTDGLNDIRVVEDPNASDLWARFYTLEDNRPFFCDRDGIMKFSLAEIGWERRTGYSWYNTSGFGVVDAFNQWVNEWGKTILISPLDGAEFLTTDTIPVSAFASKNTGKMFDKFELLLDGELYESYTSQEIKIELIGLDTGQHSVEIIASYSDNYTENYTAAFHVFVPTFELLVNNGEGDGMYAEGTVVNISADEPAEGKAFDEWAGDTEYVADINAATTTVTMPAEDIWVYARYKTASGMESSENSGIKIYPNPARDYLNISISASGITNIELIDMQGRIVYRSQIESGGQRISVEELQEGIYVLKLRESSGELHIQKIVIEKD